MKSREERSDEAWLLCHLKKVTGVKGREGRVGTDRPVVVSSLEFSRWRFRSVSTFASQLSMLGIRETLDFALLSPKEAD